MFSLLHCSRNLSFHRHYPFPKESIQLYSYFVEIDTCFLPLFVCRHLHYWKQLSMIMAIFVLQGVTKTNKHCVVCLLRICLRGVTEVKNSFLKNLLTER